MQALTFASQTAAVEVVAAPLEMDAARHHDRGASFAAALAAPSSVLG